MLATYFYFSDSIYILCPYATATVANYWASLTKIGGSLTVMRAHIVSGNAKMTGRRKSERNAVKRPIHVSENETYDKKQKQTKKQQVP
jgi:hypothetical protein